jgi:hypothetical protein
MIACGAGFARFKEQARPASHGKSYIAIPKVIDIHI